jgi:hypothetical protein
MRRFHLFEFHDQSWFPERLRSAMTAYLVAAYQTGPFARLWADQLSKLLIRDELCDLVDLGSGASGPIPLILKELEQRGFKVRVTLTDLHPNPNTSLFYWPEPVDAANVPHDLPGIRTMFSAFHHFRPETAHRILRDAFQLRRPICIFEASSRMPAAIATASLIPLAVLLLTPLIRPISWVQIVFTYLIPILPLLIFWDGLASSLRIYSVEELIALTSDLDSSTYTWEAGLIRAPRLATPLPYLIGRPV